ncbi:MAG: CDP-diacylglycerol--glycerol-3-phosphate 3-phosphatidyltransferase [Oscillospiraceae bacterium]|nr:CDP-diacylglycerol--glycerol-3-phosphate 3-phosphatidyltransferase [Oscillospiraceae bacterium]
MNTANKLTVLRVVLVPFFMAFLMTDGRGYHAAALAIFIIASLTDMIDGKIARKYNQITAFGKFADPLADKLLIAGAMLALMKYDLVSVWAVFIVLCREFIVSGIRLSAVTEGKVIAASIWGKLKTVSQMAAVIVAVVFVTFDIFPDSYRIIVDVCIWISVVLTVTSGIDYYIKNASLLKMK